MRANIPQPIIANTPKNIHMMTNAMIAHNRALASMFISKLNISLVYHIIKYL